MENFDQIFTLVAEHEGIGLNLDILETGLINILILIAILVYFPFSRLSTILNYFSINTSYIPLSFYKNLSFYTLRSDSLDRFGTKLEKRYSKEAIINLLELNGFDNLKFKKEEPYWTVVATFKINKFQKI